MVRTPALDVTVFPLSLQLFLSSVRIKMEAANTSATWCEETLSAPAPTDTSWDQITNPVTPMVKQTPRGLVISVNLNVSGWRDKEC